MARRANRLGRRRGTAICILVMAERGFDATNAFTERANRYRANCFHSVSTFRLDRTWTAAFAGSLPRDSEVKTIPSWESVEGESGMHTGEKQLDPAQATELMQQFGLWVISKILERIKGTGGVCQDRE